MPFRLRANLFLSTNFFHVRFDRYVIVIWGWSADLVIVDEYNALCFVSSHGLVIFAYNSFVISKINFGVIYNFRRSNNFVEKVVFVYEAIT